MAKKNKKKNGSRKSNASIGDKASRKGYGTDPNASSKSSNSFSGMLVGLVLVVVVAVLLAFQ